MKYYLNIGSKNTQLKLLENFKKDNVGKKDYYEEYEELKNKYSTLYNYIKNKTIDDFNKIIKKVFKRKFQYNKTIDVKFAIKFVLQLLNIEPTKKQPIIEKQIFNLV